MPSKISMRRIDIFIKINELLYFLDDYMAQVSPFYWISFKKLD